MMNLANLEEKIKSSNLLIVKVQTSWCIASRNLETNIMRIYPRYSNQVDYESLDIEKNPGLIKDYSVNVVPTLLFFKNSKLMEKVSGVITANDFENLIKKYL